VWTADPAIRDFVGLAENAWDFNAPDAITGFGALEMTDELRRQVARMVGRSLSPDERDEPALAPRAGQTAAAAAETPVGSAAAAETGESEGSDEQRNCQEQALRSGDDRDNTAAMDCGDTATQYDPAKPAKVQRPVKPSHGRALPK
jgi:hypothetical protein